MFPLENNPFMLNQLNFLYQLKSQDSLKAFSSFLLNGEGTDYWDNTKYVFPHYSPFHSPRAYLLDKWYPNIEQIVLAQIHAFI